MKQSAILLTLVIALAGCTHFQHFAVDKEGGKELVWVGSDQELKKLSDPEELKRRQDEAQKDFKPPESIESASHICNLVRAAISGKDIQTASLLENSPAELERPYGGWVFVSVYGEKAKLFRSAAKGKNAAEAALKAIRKLAAEMRGKLPAKVESLPVKVDFTETLLAVETPGAARQAFIPGVDGLWLLPESRGEYRLPAEMMAFSPATITDLALYFSILPRSDAIRRFRTRAFLQAEEGHKPIALTRSLPPVPEVSAAALKERIGAACEYLARGQREDGSYDYLYAAHRDKSIKSKEESMVRHVASAAVMVLGAEALERREFADSAARCFDFVLGKVRSEKGLAYLLKKGEGTLGGSGLLAWGLSHYRRVTGNKEYDQTARAAADFVLMMQKPEGTFFNYYDPVSKKPIDRPARFYQGEACLGLYWYYKVYGDKKYLDAAIRAAAALSRMRNKQLRKGALSLDAWLMQAARFLYPHASEKDKKEMLTAVEKMAQIMVEAQRKTKKTAGYEDMIGSFRSATQELPSGPGTAAMCEGLAAACQLIDSLGRPADKIKAALLKAARFQLRHQFEDENTYYLPNPGRAKGAIRATLTDSTVRIDHVQHTVGVWLQLLKILE